MGPKGTFFGTKCSPYLGARVYVRSGVKGLNCFIILLLFYSYGEFQAYCRQKKNKTFILKPDSGSQGKGIFLTKNPKVNLLNAQHNPV